MVKHKNSSPITKQDLTDSLIGYSEAILKGVQTMFDKHEKENAERFENLENKINKLDTEVSYVKDNIDGLKADTASSVSRREFDNLRSRVMEFAEN